MIVLLLFIGIVLGCLAFKVATKAGPAMLGHFKPKALPYDVNHVRKREMEIWGEFFTPAPEIPIPTNENRAVNQPSLCHRCGIEVGRGMDTCQNCILTATHERREARMKGYPTKQQSRVPYNDRRKVLEYRGRQYSVIMPSGVPMTAHVSIREEIGSVSGFAWALATWIDESSGRTIGNRLVAIPTNLLATPSTGQR